MAVESSYVFTGDEDKSARQRRRRIAEALMMQGMDTSPIASPWQGAARMAQSLMGGIELGMEDKRDREREAAVAAHNAGVLPALLGGGGALSAGSGEGVPSGQPIKLGGFDPSMGRVFEFEGGLNPRDTNGTPSKFGINAKANPDVNLDTLTREQAAGLYRDRYWNAIGADKMDPRLAHVAFDTAVIAGPGKAQELLKASGGDPEKFLMLRKQFQDSLLARNPEKYGPYAKAWNNRVATLGADIGVRPGGMFAVGSGQPTLQGGDTLQDGQQPVRVADASGRIQQLYAIAANPMTSATNKAIAMNEIKRLQEANDPTKALQREKLQLEVQQKRSALNPEPPTPLTPEERQKLGIRPDIPAYRQGREIKFGPAGTSITNTMNAGDKADGKFEEELAKGQAKLFTDMVTEGVNAKAETGQIRILREQLARLPGGFGTGLVALASQYGIKLSPQADAIEAASAIINKLVPGQRLPGSGQMSDRDVELFKSSLPSLMNTPEGNRIILDTMEAMAAYKEKQAEIATSVMDGDMTRKEAMKALRGLPDPLAAVRSVAKELPKPAKPTGGNTLGSPPKGVTASEWKAMTDEERALWK